jgi:hypothetical protein
MNERDNEKLFNWITRTQKFVLISMLKYCHEEHVPMDEIRLSSSS